MRLPWLAPQVIQTAITDCGPAALHCLLRGLGVASSYAQLREACQTDVDGTSIDVLEDVARQLGLPLEQVMTPLDHLTMPEAGTLPGLVVTALPGGAAHFVVLWRRVGPFVQVMDPATGRRWLRATAFARELYTHHLAVPASQWLAWARSEDGRAPWTRRLCQLGLSTAQAVELYEHAEAAPDWRALAALDAATRVVATVIDVGGLARGREAARALQQLFAAAQNDPTRIPPRYWSVREAPAQDDTAPTLVWRGAVLLRLPAALRRAGVIPTPQACDAAADGGEASVASHVQRQEQPPSTLPTPATGVLGALASQPAHPLVRLAELLQGEGRRCAALALGLLVLAAAPLLEALVVRAVMTVHERAPLGLPRALALACMLAPLFFLLWLELPVGHGLAGLGRRLELKLRLAYQTKLPRLGARYFRTRLLSDLTERAHALHHVRRLPELAARALRAAFGLCLTASAIAWLDPRAGAVSCAVVLLTLAVTLLSQPVLGERDLRKRTYEGALMRFYLDALRGLTAVHSHGAADALSTEHEALLVDWTRAGLASGRAAVAADAAVALLGALGCISLVALDVHDSGVTARTALLAFWALQLPAMASDLVLATRLYPSVRNATLRMLELLIAPDEHPAIDETCVTPTDRSGASAGVALEFRNMTVALNRRPVLQDITSSVAPGTHVAIVGASGAGKSTVLATLLGWHQVAPDSLRVDGAQLVAESGPRLRADTVWVDPSVQLWNESLLDNLCYGAREHAHASIARALDDSELHTALQGLPAGMQSSLGEGGGLLSGGEGQRVRLARALLRRPPRLVLLDEAMRGLDRSKRARLHRRLRERFKDATLLCVTHDLTETLDYDRIWVLDQGRLVEDAPPSELLRNSDSLYSKLLRAEQTLTQHAWEAQGFRQVRLVAGQLDEASTHDKHD